VEKHIETNGRWLSYWRWHGNRLLSLLRNASQVFIHWWPTL